MTKFRGQGLRTVMIRGTLPRKIARSARVVICPQCGATIGHPCLSATGKRCSPQHRSRRTKAARYYEALAEHYAGLDEQNPPTA